MNDNDSFRMLTPDDAVVAICFLAVYALLFWPVLK
jgi:hypothetical protein